MTKEEWKPLRGSKQRPDQIMLSVRSDPSRAMTVRWRTAAFIRCGYVLFRKQGSADEWTRGEAECNRFETDLDESNFWFAEMTGLAPDTYYEYTVGDDSFRSPVFAFRTAREDPEEFSFLCLSDTQTGDPEPPADYTEFNGILKCILAKHPECEFILTAGDNTNCGQTDVQWTGFMNGLSGVAERMPVMLCLGNHDDMGFADYFSFTGKYYSDKATYFSNMLRGSYPYNGPDCYKTATYSFDYGNVHISVLGTSYYEEMNEWLLHDVAKSDKAWKFAVHHFPVCYAGATTENEDTWPSLQPGMDQCDLVFSGHEHSFARSYPRRGEALFDKPSEGVVHYNLGSGNRNPPGARVIPKVWNAKTYPHEENLSMYTVVTVRGGVCTLRAYVEDGRLVDECVIDKENDRILPPDPAPVYNRTRLKFKGYDLGMCNEHTLPQKINGVWYLCPGPLMGFTGGTAERSPGKIRVEIYGRFAEFTENSAVMLTSEGEQTMAGPCLRLNEGQLFVPIDDFCRPLRMHALYFERNNFISVESETEARCIAPQP